MEWKRRATRTRGAVKYLLHFSLFELNKSVHRTHNNRNVKSSFTETKSIVSETGANVVVLNSLNLTWKPEMIRSVIFSSHMMSILSQLFLLQGRRKFTIYTYYHVNFKCNSFIMVTSLLNWKHNNNIYLQFLSTPSSQSFTITFVCVHIFLIICIELLLIVCIGLLLFLCLGWEEICQWEGQRMKRKICISIWYWWIYMLNFLI